MKLNCGEQEQESIRDLNISEEICDEYICEVFANYLRIKNYSLNTDLCVCCTLGGGGAGRGACCFSLQTGQTFLWPWRAQMITVRSLEVLVRMVLFCCFKTKGFGFGLKRTLHCQVWILLLETFE